MAEYKYILVKEFYKRLAKELDISIESAKELHKGYAKVYLECIKNGESFPLPAIGMFRMLPYKEGALFRNPKTNEMAPPKAKYWFSFSSSKDAERARREAT